MLLQDESLLII